MKACTGYQTVSQEIVSFYFNIYTFNICFICVCVGVYILMTMEVSSHGERSYKKKFNLFFKISYLGNFILSSFNSGSGITKSFENKMK